MKDKEFDDLYQKVLEFVKKNKVKDLNITVKNKEVLIVSVDYEKNI